MKAVWRPPGPAIVSLAEASVCAWTMGKTKLLLAELLLVSSAAGVAGSLLTIKMPEAPQVRQSDDR